MTKDISLKEIWIPITEMIYFTWLEINMVKNCTSSETKLYNDKVLLSLIKSMAALTTAIADCHCCQCYFRWLYLESD